MKSGIASIALGLAMFAGCATDWLYLEPGPGKSDDLFDLWPCVHVAYAEIRDGDGPLTPKEQEALGGRDVTFFLDWKQFLSSPRPVVWNGRPTAVKSATPFLEPKGDPLVTQRYVLCLLRNGYQWPAEPVTEPPRSAPDPATPASG
jgi:hypothetical protein